MSELLSTDNLLHPQQVTELNAVKQQNNDMLNSAPHIRSQIEDPQAMVDQIRAADNDLKQAAREIPPDQIDAAVKLEEALREKWVPGMCTQAEMRKNSPGCVDKHRKWEATHKTDVLQWKNICRRLHASGISKNRLEDEGDISNIEMFRPVGGSGELSMDNAQIPGKDWKLPPPGADPVVIFTQEEKDLLEKIDPELREALVVMPNDLRRKVLDLVQMPKPTAVPVETKPKTEITKLRATAKGLGINCYQKSKATLIEEIEAKEAA